MARDYGKYVGALLLFGSNGIVASGIALPSSSVVLLRTLLGSLLLVVLLLAAKRRVTFHRHLGDLGCLAASGAALGASWLFLFEAYRHLGGAPPRSCTTAAPSSWPPCRRGCSASG